MVAQAGKQPPAAGFPKLCGKSAKNSALVSLPTLQAKRSYIACVAVRVVAELSPAKPQPNRFADAAPAANGNMFSQYGMGATEVTGVLALANLANSVATGK